MNDFRNNVIGPCRTQFGIYSSGPSRYAQDYAIGRSNNEKELFMEQLQCIGHAECQLGCTALNAGASCVLERNTIGFADSPGRSCLYRWGPQTQTLGAAQHVVAWAQHFIMQSCSRLSFWFWIGWPANWNAWILAKFPSSDHAFTNAHCTVLTIIPSLGRQAMLRIEAKYLWCQINGEHFVEDDVRF